MAQGFSATVNAWVKETKARQRAVFQEATQRTIAIAQAPVSEGGNMPVRTGFLRASGVAVKGEDLPALKESPNGGSFEWSGSEVNLVIAGADLGDKITFAWSARYAMRVNYGFVGEDSLGRTYHQSGRKFRDLAAQQWSRVVSESAAELQGRVQGASAAAIYQAGG